MIAFTLAIFALRHGDAGPLAFIAGSWRRAG